jgi:hypothetical protein
LLEIFCTPLFTSALSYDLSRINANKAKQNKTTDRVRQKGRSNDNINTSSPATISVTILLNLLTIISTRHPDKTQNNTQSSAYLLPPQFSTHIKSNASSTCLTCLSKPNHPPPTTDPSPPEMKQAPNPDCGCLYGALRTYRDLEDETERANAREALIHLHRRELSDSEGEGGNDDEEDGDDINDHFDDQYDPDFNLDDFLDDQDFLDEVLGPLQAPHQGAHVGADADGGGMRGVGDSDHMSDARNASPDGTVDGGAGIDSDVTVPAGDLDPAARGWPDQREADTFTAWFAGKCLTTCEIEN